MERWRIIVDRALNTFRHMLKYGGNNHRFEDGQIEFNRSDNVLWAKLTTLSISEEFKLQEIFGLSAQETNLLRLALAVRVVKSGLLDFERNRNQNKEKEVGLVRAGENLRQEIVDLISEDPGTNLKAYYTLAQSFALREKNKFLLLNLSVISKVQKPPKIIFKGKNTPGKNIGETGNIGFGTKSY